MQRLPSPTKEPLVVSTLPALGAALRLVWGSLLMSATWWGPWGDSRPPPSPGEPSRLSSLRLHFARTRRFVRPAPQEGRSVRAAPRTQQTRTQQTRNSSPDRRHFSPSADLNKKNDVSRWWRRAARVLSRSTRRFRLGPNLRFYLVG